MAMPAYDPIYDMTEFRPHEYGVGGGDSGLASLGAFMQQWANHMFQNNWNDKMLQEKLDEQRQARQDTLDQRAWLAGESVKQRAHESDLRRQDRGYTLLDKTLGSEDPLQLTPGHINTLMTPLLGGPVTDVGRPVPASEQAMYTGQPGSPNAGGPPSLVAQAQTAAQGRLAELQGSFQANALPFQQEAQDRRDNGDEAGARQMDILAQQALLGRKVTAPPGMFKPLAQKKEERYITIMAKKPANRTPEDLDFLNGYHAWKDEEARTTDARQMRRETESAITEELRNITKARGNLKLNDAAGLLHNLNTPGVAQAVGIPQFLALMVGGQGHGFRMTQAEINNLQQAAPTVMQYARQIGNELFFLSNDDKTRAGEEFKSITDAQKRQMIEAVKALAVRAAAQSKVLDDAQLMLAGGADKKHPLVLPDQARRIGADWNAKFTQMGVDYINQELSPSRQIPGGSQPSGGPIAPPRFAPQGNPKD